MISIIFLAIFMFSDTADYQTYGTPVFQPIKKKDFQLVNESIYILNFHDAQILRYNLEGQLVNRIGSKGKGPGELRYPDAFWVDKDALYVLDQSNYHISVFAHNGTFKERFRLPKRKIELAKTSSGWAIGDWLTTFEGEDKPVLCRDQGAGSPAGLICAPTIVYLPKHPKSSTFFCKKIQCGSRPCCPNIFKSGGATRNRLNISILHKMSDEACLHRAGGSRKNIFSLWG